MGSPQRVAVHAAPRSQGLQCKARRSARLAGAPQSELPLLQRCTRIDRRAQASVLTNKRENLIYALCTARGAQGWVGHHTSGANKGNQGHAFTHSCSTSLHTSGNGHSHFWTHCTREHASRHCAGRREGRREAHHRNTHLRSTGLAGVATRGAAVRPHLSAHTAGRATGREDTQQREHEQGKQREGAHRERVTAG